MRLPQEKIDLLRAYFSKQPVCKAYLFGSHARREATHLSDVDLLVELDHSQPIGLQFVQMQFDLESLLGEKVDLVSTNGLSKYIKPIIDQEKELVYAR
ncbi:MAG: nucleotidyltransferase domain-containing protein [Bacteroidota bacterium]